MKTTAYIHLQDKEIFGSAACGCNIDGQAFYQCPLHAAAPELLEACKNVVRGIDNEIAANPQAKTGLPTMAAYLRKAIAEAEGRHD